MHSHQAKIALAQRFLETVVISPDRVLSLADEIQERGKRRPDLTCFCKFGRSMQVRRLRSVSTRGWNHSDYANAESILDEIESLQAQAQSPQVILALAVLGMETDGLPDAMNLLSVELADDESAKTQGPPEPRSGEEQSHVVEAQAAFTQGDAKGRGTGSGRRKQ